MMPLTQSQIIKRINNLKYAAPILLIISAFIIYSDFSKEKFESKNDLSFISGPFESYTFLNQGRNSYFKIRLHNYNRDFDINMDYVKLFKLSKFKQMLPGEILSLGILTPNLKYLHSSNHYIGVYSVDDLKDNYLSVTDSIQQWKFMSLVARVMGLSILGCSIICVAYYYKLRRLFQ